MFEQAINPISSARTMIICPIIYIYIYIYIYIHIYIYTVVLKNVVPSRYYNISVTWVINMN